MQWLCTLRCLKAARQPGLDCVSNDTNMRGSVIALRAEARK